MSTPAPIAVLSSRESLGDCFMKLPLLRALKRAYPDRAVHWVVSESGSPFATVLSSIARPLVADVVGPAHIERPVRAALANLRRLPRYSLVIDTRSNVNRVALARCALRYDTFLTPTPGYLLSQRRPRRLFRSRHRAERLLDLLSAVTDGSADAPFELEIPADKELHARTLLPNGPQYVGFGPGAASERKLWPLERFIALANGVAGRGFVPVFLLGPNERALAPRLRDAVRSASFPGDADGHLVDPELTLAIGRRLTAAVANDTGVGHMMAAVGTPLVSLFGPTEPWKWAPRGVPIETLYTRDFDRSSREMSAIPLDAVSAALDRILAGVAARRERGATAQVRTDEARER